MVSLVKAVVSRLSERWQHLTSFLAFSFAFWQINRRSSRLFPSPLWLECCWLAISMRPSVSTMESVTLQQCQDSLIMTLYWQQLWRSVKWWFWMTYWASQLVPAGCSAWSVTEAGWLLWITGVGSWETVIVGLTLEPSAVVVPVVLEWLVVLVVGDNWVGDLTSLAFPGYCSVGTVKQFTAFIQFIQNCGIQPHFLSIPTLTVLFLKRTMYCFWELSLSAISTVNQLNMPCSNKWYNKHIRSNKWTSILHTVCLYCWFGLMLACLGYWYFTPNNLLQQEVRLFTNYFAWCETCTLFWASGKAGHGQDPDANSDADTNSDPMQIEPIVITCVQCITLCYSSVVLVSPWKGWKFIVIPLRQTTI